MTFKQCAEALIEAKRPGWRNAKHAQQWANTLRDYAYPSLGDKAPSEVSLADVKAILLPMWATKTETATRVRQRIEAVLDYAAVHDLCDGTRNPARWKGMLDKVLPKPDKVRTREHHAAAAYADLPRIMAALRDKGHVSALALRFIILTACRSGEGRGATWDEIDLDAKVWTIPAARMKAAKPHRVPLAEDALEILRTMQQWRREDCTLVFPGARGGLLSDVAVNKTLHSIAPDVTVHGFRSAFRDWAAEQTAFPARVCELCLAHGNPDKVEAAYQRSDLFEKRRQLMDAWAKYCSGSNKVVQLAQVA
jgi:integrase